MKRFFFWIRMLIAQVHMDLYVRPSLNVYKVKWSLKDEADLRAYLHTESGEKLQAVVLAYIQSTDQQAVGISTPRACGYAVGQRSLLANIIALSGHTPPQASEPETEELQGLPRLRNPFPEPGNKKPENL